LNILDITVYAILIVSVAAGVYQGLVATSANTAGFFLSMFSAALFYPGMAMRIKAGGTVIKSLLYYSETSQMLGTVETARAGVAGMTKEGMAGLLQSVSLPHPIGDWFTENVLGGVYAKQGLSTLGDYLSQTVAEAAVSIACFLMIFLFMYVILTVAVNLLHYVVKLPQLKAFDGVLGGAVGLLRGAVIAFALFMALPVALSMLPVQQVKDLVETSHTAAFFYQKDFMFAFIRSFIS
jgi:uncharacterized membrane protein required for colicin V production